jgi:hypothetical protein
MPSLNQEHAGFLGSRILNYCFIVSILTVTVIVGFGLFGKNQESKNNAFVGKPPINVLIVRTDTTDQYERRIIDGFTKRLNQTIGIDNYQIVTELAGPNINPNIPKGKEWEKIIENAKNNYTSSHIDYVVSIATNASTAVKKFGLLDGLGDVKGQIFLGVTNPFHLDSLCLDPSCTSLVAEPERSKDKNEYVSSRVRTRTFHTPYWNYSDRDIDKERKNRSWNITGVRYGPGEKYGNEIDKLFVREQKLVFPFNKSYQQDDSAAESLKNLNKTSLKNRFDIREQKTDVKWTDLTDWNKLKEVYMAWLQLDDLNTFEGGNPSAQNKMLVVSTCNKENLDRGRIVVSVNDWDIGILGADILSQNNEDKNALGEIPIAFVPFKVWLDCREVKRYYPGISEKMAKGLCNNDKTCPTRSTL